jgi:Aspartate/tyrosine/aromatic aminotransferase
MPLTLSRCAKNIAPSLTLKIDAKAKEMKANGIDVVGFGAGEPDFDTPEPIRNAAKEALDKGMTRYTPVPGTVSLRQAICDKLLKDNGLTYEPADIIVSNGAKHSLFTLLQCILNEGDEVIIPTPCWVSYPEMVKMSGGVPVYVKTREEDNFIPSKEAMAACISEKTKAFILTSPSNPNGSVWSKQQLTDLADLAVNNDFYVVSDEIYEKLLYDGKTHLSIAALNDDIKARTLLVNGVSKSYAMTGWRIGYTAGPREVIKAMTNYQSQSASNPNAMAQYAATEALTGDQNCVETMRKEFEARRNYMVKRLGAIPGLSCQMPEGAFYVMMNIKPLLGKKYNGQTVDTSMAFADILLNEKHVAVVPGIAFEAEGYCRLSYAISLEAIEKGLNRIAEFTAAMQ